MHMIGRQFVAALLLNFATFGLVSAYAQTPRERHERIRTAVDGQNLIVAINELQAWRGSQPDVFALNNYDYLLARLAERTGDRATAAVNYQRVAARNSLLSEYAIWHLAQFARMTGNLTLEREQLRQFLATSPGSLLRNAVGQRLAQSLIDSGDFAGAIYELKLRLLSTTGVTARETRALLGQAYLRNNQPEQARETFNGLITDLADESRPDDFALASVRALDVLDSGGEEAAQQGAPQLSETEYLRRARIYHFNRDFARARLHYAAFVRHFPQSATVPDALYQIGRTFYQDGQYENALASLRRVLDKYPDRAPARDAQIFSASCLGRLKQTDEAIASYRRFIERYPDAPDPERPFLNIIDTLRDAGRDHDALDWVERTRTRFKGQLPSRLALFSRARIYLRNSDWPRALIDLEALRNESDLGGARVPGGTSSAEVSYLRALVLEQMGRTEDAVNAYLEISDGRYEYYGGRATERLQALARAGNTREVIVSHLESLRREARVALAGAQPEKVRTASQSALRLTEDKTIADELIGLVRTAYANLPSYNVFSEPKLLPKGRAEILTSGTTAVSSSATLESLANELLFLGIYDEGAPALAASEENSNTGGLVTSTLTPSPKLSRDEAYTIAVLFKRGSLAEHSISYAEPLWKNVPRDYLIELAPRQMVELLYPAPYADILIEHATPRGVDSRFVLSIMRQESRFRPDAKSVSAARGLMQFIPATANKIAAQLGKRDFRLDDLYNPRSAILFGSEYLGNLFKLFPNMPQAVAASYNGGEDNVARWVSRANSFDPDRYVPEIGFAQSKDYVYRIMANFRVYQQLYGEELQSR